MATIEILTFFIICYFLTGNIDFIKDTSSPFNLVFLSSAVFIILGQYVSEPFFTTPLGAISNSIAAILILLAANNSDSLLFYPHMMILFVAVLICAIGVLFLNVIDMAPRVKQLLLSISTTLGKSKVLYSFVYLSGVVSYLRSDSEVLTTMLVAWVLVVCTPFFEAVVRIFSKFTNNSKRNIKKGSMIDCIPGKYCIASFPSISKGIDASSYLLLIKQGPDRWYVCSICKAEHLSSETIVSGLCFPTPVISNSDIGDGNIRAIAGDNAFDAMLINKNDIASDQVSAVEASILSSRVDSIIGIVDERSSIETITIRLLKDESDSLYQTIHEGAVVEALIKSEWVMYQIINGIDHTNQCKSKSLTPFVYAYARKLGAYDAEQNSIDGVMWLPELGSPVFMRSRTESEKPKLSIGKLPGTCCHICIKDMNALITHNTAVLGILGVGKSCLSFELIQKVMQADETRDARVICLDLTNEYKKALEYYGVRTCQPNDEALIENLRTSYTNAEKSKDDGGNLKIFRIGIRAIIESFMDGKYGSGVLVINPEKYEVSKQTTDGKSSNYGKPPYDLTPFADLSSAEITRIISEEALDYCKTTYSGSAAKAKLLLIFEEAHSLVPEWSSAANDGDRNAANGTARVILQGRKYGLGSMVITQRTANVSKSILNQCNTVFALRVFDDTGKQFLENYVGSDYAAMLPTLKERHAIAAGKALKLTCPVEIELNDKDELLNPLPHLLP